jgi:hypothetical protein
LQEPFPPAPAGCDEILSPTFEKDEGLIPILLADPQFDQQSQHEWTLPSFSRCDDQMKRRFLCGKFLRVSTTEKECAKQNAFQRGEKSFQMVHGAWRDSMTALSRFCGA